MGTSYNYTVYPIEVDTNAFYRKERDYHADLDFVLFPISITVIAIIVAIVKGHGTFWVFGLVFIALYYLIKSLVFGYEDSKHTEKIIARDIKNANLNAEFYTKHFNSILSKSEEIINQILPYFEGAAKEFIDNAKIKFSRNAYSPFWSEIEMATKYLACYKDALNQLCLNREVYTYALSHHRHNFPIPFPLATDISISQIVINEYNAIIEEAQTKETFSIIWEQRRNSEILMAGFKTLENAIYYVGSDIVSSITELKHSINVDINELKFANKKQLESLSTNHAYLNEILHSMDTKLYYIQYNKKPLGPFFYR